MAARRAAHVLGSITRLYVSEDRSQRDIARESATKRLASAIEQPSERSLTRRRASRRWIGSPSRETLSRRARTPRRGPRHRQARQRPQRHRQRPSGPRGARRAVWRVATWSAASLLQAKKVARDRRMATLGRLFAAHDVVMLQQVRASPEASAPAVLPWRRDLFIEHDAPANGAWGGVARFVRRRAQARWG